MRDINDKSNPNNVAVCVTGQHDCDRLMRAGRELANSTGGSLLLMSALPRLYDQDAAMMLEYLYECSAHAGAQMVVMYTNRPCEALTDGFRRHGIGHVLLGGERRRGIRMFSRLRGVYPGATYYALDEAGRARQAHRRQEAYAM